MAVLPTPGGSRGVWGDLLNTWLLVGHNADGSNIGFLAPVGVKTANYSAAAGELVPVDTTSGAVTITLPNAPADGTRVGVKHVIQGGTNAVTVACAGVDVFNKAGGSTSGALTLLNQGFILHYKASGAIWYVEANDIPLSQLDGHYDARYDALGAATAATITSIGAAAGLALVLGG